MPRRFPVIAALLLVSAIGCAPQNLASGPIALRVDSFPNITPAQAMIGVAEGASARAG